MGTISKTKITFAELMSLVDRSDGLCLVIKSVRNIIYSEDIMDMLIEQYGDYYVEGVGTDTCCVAVSLGSQKSTSATDHYNESVYLPGNMR